MSLGSAVTFTSSKENTLISADSLRAVVHAGDKDLDVQCPVSGIRIRFDVQRTSKGELHWHSEKFCVTFFT